MFKKFLAFASLLSCALTTHSLHALEPAVLFVGGNIMYNWQSSGISDANVFPIFYGSGFQINDAPGICHETQQAQDAVNNSLPNYPNIVAVHLMVGADDVMGTDDANPPAFVFQQWQTCYTNLVDSVLNAHRKLVLGTIPFTLFNDPKPYNDFIFTLAAAKGVPVIDYYTLLRRANDNFEGTEYWIPQSDTVSTPSITSKGYAIMNAIASSVIDEYVNGVTLKAGYLGNDTLQTVGDPPFIPASSQNTVAPNTKQHWQAYGQYSDGSTAVIQNANINGVYGTWTSSNPAVISIDQYGTSYALALGTANIHFTTPAGQTINEWTMNVVATGPN